jgi:hypothetical protein
MPITREKRDYQLRRLLAIVRDVWSGVRPAPADGDSRQPRTNCNQSGPDLDGPSAVRTGCRQPSTWSSADDGDCGARSRTTCSARGDDRVGAGRRGGDQRHRCRRKPSNSGHANLTGRAVASRLRRCAVEHDVGYFTEGTTYERDLEARPRGDCAGRQESQMARRIGAWSQSVTVT